VTISTEAIKSSVFAGNGSTTGFAITFKTFSQNDLTVTLTNSSGVESVKSLTTHYTVSLNANQDNNPGGTVTMGTPPANGEKLVIVNEPEYTQSSDIVNGGGFFPNVIEDMVDRNTILSRRAQEQTSRSIQIPISDSTGTTVELPTETLRASKAVVFDANGNVGVSTDNYVDQVATVAASATAAASSATASASSATASASSATASASSATAAATSYDNFDDRFLGAKSRDPSVDNDGDALITGALYFNSSNNVMMVYTGSAWVRTTPTSSDQTHINTVSGIQANVTTVAGIASNVTTCAGISSDISAVAADASDIGVVAADGADIGAVAAKATEIGRLGTADAVADMAILGTSAIVTDMDLLGTSANVTAMGHLGTSANVTAMGLLGTSAVVTDMGILGTADVVSDMNTLATSDVVSDLNTLATSDVVSDMNTLATSANVTAMGLLGTSANVTAMGLLGTSAVVTDLSILGTADVVTDLNTLGTADVVSDLNTLGTADVVSDMNTLGTSANVTNMATCAANLSSINSYGDTYSIASSAPGSPNEGDLWYDSTNNVLKVHNGTTFVAVTSATAGIMNVADDSTPQLGGDLDLNGNNIDFPTTANISDCIDDDTFGTASATKLATSESIKAYVDSIEASDITTAGVTFANYNTISGNATTTTASTKNMFLMGTISVTSTAVWTIAGNGVLTII